MLPGGSLPPPTLFIPPDSEPLRKRPRGGEELPETTARNKRLFGSLLGTLRRFQKEEDGDKRQDETAKRSTMLRRAEEKQLGASSAAKQADKANRKRRQVAEEVGRLQAAHAQWLERHTRLAALLVTNAKPQLHWLPGRTSAATDAILAERLVGASAEEAAALERLNCAVARLQEAAPPVAPADELTGEKNGHEEAEEMKLEAADH